MKICIDPGHGGNDSGAVNTQDTPDGARVAMEKDINLSASFMLAGVLNSYGHQAILTRIDDETMSLQGRCDQANDVKSDLFISIHCNSFDQPEPRGFEIYHYPNSSKGEEVAEHILQQMSYIPWLCQHGDGIKPVNFYVLKHTQMPAVLAELSFMSNPDDLEKLRHPDILFTIMRNMGKAIHELLTTF